MSGESFLAISTGCLNVYDGNTRSSFSNNFAKPAKTSRPWKYSLYIDIEQINFEYTPLYYENDVPDFSFADSSGSMSYYSFKKCYSIQSLLNQFQHSHFCGVIHSENTHGVKIMLESFYDGIKIHKKLVKLLNITFQIEPYPEDNSEYFVLKKGVQYISDNPILLNRTESSYVDLICEEIEPYFCDGQYKKIVARINVSNNYGHTIHMDTLIRRFYKINNSVLSTVSFNLRQPNGSRLLMEEGPPTIIKARIKEMKTESDFFYTQVSSTPTKNYPENTPSKFTAELPNELSLKGEWKVALAYAELPPTSTSFKQTTDYLVKNKNVGGVLYKIVILIFNRYTKKYVDFNRIVFQSDDTRILTKKDLMITLQAWDARFRIYVDENGEFKIYSLNPEYVIFFCILPLHLGEFFQCEGVKKVEYDYVRVNYIRPNQAEVDDITAIFATSSWKHETSCFEIEVLDEKKLLSKYRFIFTVNEYYHNETAVTQEKTFTLSPYKNRDEEKTLLKIYEDKYHIKKELNKVPTWMFVYADFVKPSLIADCYSNVLKLLPYKLNYESGHPIFYTFTPLDFFIVNKDSIKTLSFELRSHAGEIHDFRDNHNTNTTLTLFFMKTEE
jgi:hypothetical protein